MGQNTDLVTGLDIGTTKICAIIAEVEGNSRPNVIGVGMAPCNGLRKGIVVDIDATTKAIKDAVQQAERMSGEEVRSVVVGFTGEHVACLNSRSVIAINHPGQEILPGDIERLTDTSKNIVLPPEREIMHAIPRWYSIDGQAGVHSPVGMCGSRVEMETHIVTGLSSFIQNVLKCVHGAGLSIEGTVLEPIADGECVLNAAEKELGVCLVDIGGGTSDIAIYIDGEIYYSGAVPIGGNHVTRDVAIGLRASLDEAERVKVTYGSATLEGVDDREAFEVVGLGGGKARHLPRRILAEIIEPRIVELCSLVMEHIEKAGCQDRLPAGLVFTGGGARLDGLLDLATGITGYSARLGTPSGLAGLVDAVSSPSCSTAAGLVLYWNRYFATHKHEDGEVSIFAGLLKRIKELISRFGGE